MLICLKNYYRFIQRSCPLFDALRIPTLDEVKVPVILRYAKSLIELKIPLVENEPKGFPLSHISVNRVNLISEGMELFVF